MLLANDLRNWVKVLERFPARKESKVKDVEAGLAKAHLRIKDQAAHICDQDK